MRSDAIKKGPRRAPARAMLRATGLDDEALARPMVAVIGTFTDVMPCTMHLRELAGHAAAGVREAGGTPFEFGTVAVSDGIAMSPVGPLLQKLTGLLDVRAAHSGHGPCSDRPRP